MRLLWPFTRSYRGLLALTFAATLLATLTQLAVPRVTAAVVDGPIADGDRAGLVPAAGRGPGLGVAEAALFLLRRRAMNSSSPQIERDLRETLYQRLQRQRVRPLGGGVQRRHSRHRASSPPLARWHG